MSEERMTIDTSREAVEQINEELSWDNSFGAIELINALLAERDAALAEVARLSTPPDDAEVLLRTLRSHRGLNALQMWAMRDQAADALTRLYHAHAAERKLADDLAEAVEGAFFAGFSEGQDGTWVEGDPTPAWKKSEAYVVFTRHTARRKE